MYMSHKLYYYLNSIFHLIIKHCNAGRGSLQLLLTRLEKFIEKKKKLIKMYLNLKLI